MVVSGSGMRTRDMHWLQRVADGSLGFEEVRDVLIHDVTDHFSCLGVFGPNSRKLLEELTEESLTTGALGYLQRNHTCNVAVDTLSLLQRTFLSAQQKR